MLDCTYFLYKALLKQFPYTPSPETEYAAGKLEQIEGHIDGLTEPCQINMIELLDCTEALADDRGTTPSSSVWTWGCPSLRNHGIYRPSCNSEPIRKLADKLQAQP